MKIILIGSLAVCSMLLSTACSNEELVEQSLKVQGNFTIEANIGVESRTYVDEDKTGKYDYITLWAKKDKIYVASMNGNSHAELTLATAHGLTNGQFTGDLFGDPKKLEYAVYPVPNKNGFIDMTTRSYDQSAAPMVGSYDIKKQSVKFDNQTAMIRLFINNFPGGDFTVEGDEIAGLGTVVKVGNGYAIDFQENLSDVITVNGAPAGQSEFFIPIVIDPTATSVVEKDLTIKIGAAEITKKIGLMKNLITHKQEPNANGKIYAFMDLTYHADTKELTEKWDGMTAKALDLTAEPIEIHDAAQLYALSQAVNNGNNFSGKTIKLINDIDLNNKEWTPIGMIGQDGAVSFRGTFDGNGKTIKNLRVNNKLAGLFGQVWGATIKDLTIENANIQGSEKAGKLMAYVHGSAETMDVPTQIENVVVNGAAVLMAGEEVTDFFGERNENAVVLIDGKEYKSEGVSTDTENENAYFITSLKGLLWFADQVKNGESFKDQTITLGTDIDLENQPWTPISGFKGTFDGANFTISNLNVAVTGTASAGLFADGIGATIKNLKLQNVNVNGNWRTGAIIGDGSCVTIENCHVNGGNVTSTPHLISGKYDYGNHAGGIVGYLAADGGNASVTDCSVTGLTISAYRDVAGIAGTVTAADGGIPTVKNNKVTATTIIADQTVDYIEEKAANAGEIVGRKAVEPTMIDNTVGKDVIVKAYVKEAESMAQTLTNSAQNIEVILMNDINLPISSLGTITGGSGEYKLGGEETKNITIDLNKKKLNITTTNWSAIGAKNENATFTIRNGEMTSSQPTGTWNSYDLTLANCNYVIEGVVFNKAVALASSNKSITMTGVEINETHAYYALWIEAKGQNVVINGLTVNSGRGIKIDEQYVATPTKVTLNVSNADFNTNEKAAIMVKSAAGADIILNNIDISGVVDDKVNAVWVDEDSADSYDLVTVTGGKKKRE